MTALKSIKLNEKGATAHEAALGIFIVVVLISLIIFYVKPAQLIRRVKNLSIKIAIHRVVGDAESYVASYGEIPNSCASFNSLSEEVLQYEESCEFFGLPSYRCLFRPRFVKLPKTCDETRWETDKLELGNFDCYMLYSASSNIEGNDKKSHPKIYRVYAKSWNKDSSYIVYESTWRDKYYSCPSNFRDKDPLSFCTEI